MEAVVRGIPLYVPQSPALPDLPHTMREQDLLAIPCRPTHQRHPHERDP